MEIASYLRPPVVEVLAAVRFTPLPHWLVMTLGEFWREELQKDFPHISEQPPYAAPAESFDRPSRFTGIKVELGQQAPPLPRFWWSSPTGDELLQIQGNWFACNWRRVTPDAEYGRWGSRRAAFRRRFAQLAGWLRERGASLQVDQCEVTYINHIFGSPLWATHADAAAIFAPLTGSRRGVRNSGQVIEMEEIGFQQRFLLRSEDGTERGRLHVAMQPAYSQQTDEPIFALELTARGRPAGETLEAALELLDAERAAIVQCFGDIITEQAAEEWERQS